MDGDGMITMTDLLPDYLTPHVRMINPAVCLHLDINTLLLDIDNTLSTHGNPEPYLGVKDWVHTMAEGGIQLIIVSNNNEKRVSTFAKKLGLPYIARAAKPLPFAFHQAMKQMHCFPCNAAVIGDQLFTDMLGGSLAGIRGILVTEITPEKGWFFRLKRRLERRILEKMKIVDDSVYIK